ncbi:unnamed protein product [Rotaria sordida]|uniref:Helitron helicase-like domain-containing protein n=1 Tax=Rotaria sordida TaxID=392033 RepID=A0A818X6E1_9BILA|nr:unnamed protein product [Rotaria sordida]
MEQLTDTYKRAEIVASHLVATAKYFHLFISNILDTMIVGGVLGPIKAYFGTVESQGRGSLHLHLLIWLDHDMKLADMKDKIQNADFRERLKAYLEDIIKEDLDEFKDKHVFENLDDIKMPRSWNTPPRLSRDNIYAALSTMDLTGLQQNIYGPNNIISTPLKEQFVSSILHVSALPNKLLQTPTRNQSTFVINASYNESKVIPACLSTPNPSSPNFASRFRADIVQLVEASNIHKHSDTCYKYWNTNKDDKKSCRMRMPRTLVPVSTIDPDTDVIDDDIFDDEIIDDENNNEEQFQIQTAEDNKKYVLVNTRIDYQYRSAILNNPCLYNFVSTLYKNKMNTTDQKYLSKTTETIEENANQKGRPPNERSPFQKQHPQASTHLMMKYSEPHVPILYGPQIPRRDRDDT